MQSSCPPLPFFLLFISVLYLSCRGPENSSLSQTNGNGAESDSVVNPDLNADLQLAEYVVDVYEDRVGDLWFGTINLGAARYDGESLSYFTTAHGLCGNIVTSFAEDQEGNLWFGTHSGICKFDGVDFSEAWTSGEDSSFPWHGVAADKDGTIWARTNEGVFRQQGDSFVFFDIPIDRKSITSYSISPGKVGLCLHDSQGNWWFGTDGDGVYRYDGKSFTHYSKKDGLCSNVVSAVAEDKNGLIWISCIQASTPKMTGDGGVCTFYGSGFTSYPHVEGLSHNDIYSLYTDKEGKIWIGANGLGVYIHDGETFTLFKGTDRMDITPHMGIQGILEDKQGRMWFGFSGGLFRLEDSSLVNITRGDL